MQYRIFLCFFLISFVNLKLSNAEADQITSSNVDKILQETEVVLINFYADWCRFSQILAPEFDKAADTIRKEIPDETKVRFAKLDCDKENGIAAKYRVSKYPTIKLFRYGEMTKREYRGRRSHDQLLEYIREQIKDPKSYPDSQEALENINRSSKKRNIIAFFEQAQGEDYNAYSKVASMLRDDCNFYVAAGEIWAKERAAGNRIVYRPNDEHHSDIPYAGSISDYQSLWHWTVDKCVPIVREITFENAEELTEEGLPFVILFYHPDDKETPEIFSKTVAHSLLTEKTSVNFLTADGLKFTHPLHHLGKSERDLPILAIDSFRHMYEFPHKNLKESLHDGQLLKNFIADLHSGKLHREFHNGPDPTEAPAKTDEPNDKNEESKPNPDVEVGTAHIPKEKEGQKEEKKRTAPPESTFKKLAPSRNRYTLIRDEL